MKNIILATTAACGLAFAAVPAIADNHEVQLTASQQATYDAWSAENRTTYDAWPMDAQTYYWTLTQAQQKIWWDRLTNEQRVRIVGMTPADRTTAWTSINSQVAAPMQTTTTSGMSGTMRINYNSGGQVQAIDTTPAPADLPICTPEQQDNCINRGAR